MIEKKKRRQKTIWVPKDWLDWAEQFYSENRKELEKLGIKSNAELYWRSALLGREDLTYLVEQLRLRRTRRTSLEREA